MFVEENLCAEWPGSEIVVASEGKVVGLDLPAATVDFLLTSGMPRELSGMVFDYDRGLPECRYAGPRPLSGIPEVGQSYYVIGSYSQAFLVALEKGSGTVLLLPDGGWRECGLVNTSIKHFARCTIAFDQFLAGLPDDVVFEELDRTVIIRIGTQVARIDPLAFIHPENWWSYRMRTLWGEY